MITRLNAELLKAIQDNDLDVFMKNLAKGTNLSDRDEQSNSLIILAAFAGSDKIIEFLLDQGVAINETTAYGLTPIMAAACNGNLETVQFLISKGGNQHLQAANGQRALDFAVENEHLQVIEYLKSI